MLDTQIQGFRLSPQQRRLWSLQETENSQPYRVRGSVLITGQLDAKVLKKALHQTILKHEVLRTTIRLLPGMEFPVQVIREDPVYEFIVHDLSHSSVSARDASVRQSWQETEKLSFDLAEGPLVNASLFTSSLDEHLFQLCLPALCTDEAGLVTLMREIALTYASLLRDEHDDATPLQHADISEVLNDLLESEETAAGRAYWLQQDIGSTRVELPFDYYHGRGQRFAPQSLEFTFNPELVKEIGELAHIHNVSIAILLQACWHILLWKITGEEKIGLGTAFSGRSYEGLGTVPGLFASYLPISSRQQEDHQLRHVLDQLQQAASEASEQQDYFDAERIAGIDSTRAEPFFFPFCFEFVESPGSLQIAGGTWTFRQQDSCIDRFEVKLRCVANTEEDLRIEFQYDAARIAAKTMEQLALSYQMLVMHALQQPNAHLRELEIGPLTAHGKRDNTESEQSYVAPQTPLEELLANIWAGVLKLERVSIHDNFFELGGDSIRSIQVRAALEKVGMEFSLEQLFEHQTVYELAQDLKAKEPLALAPVKTEPFSLISSEERSRMPAEVEDAYPLTMLQSGMLFHREYSPDSAIYHDLTSFHLRGQVNMHVLREAIKQLAARHAILRTAFDLTSFSEPLQLVYKTAEIPLEEIDLRSVSEAEQEKVLKDWMETQKLRVFDPSRAPLMRFSVHRRSEETIQFTINCHHAILDGWSVAVMMSELFHLYFSGLGKTEPLPAPPAATFRDFVALERNALDSKECADYWLQRLSDHTVLTLPRWHDSTAETTESSHPFLHEVRLTDEVSDGLRQLSRVAGVPMKSVLLAAHLRVMSLIGGQTDVLTGVVTNCRPEEADSERTVGLFLNTIPFRQQLSGGEWIDLVRETFASEREMLPHRWFPLAEMQRRLGSGHLFETAFNFIHFHVYESVSGFTEMQPLGVDTFEQTNHALTASFSLEVPSLRVNLGLLCDPAQLQQEQVEAIAGYYVKTLEAMATEPRRRYETLPLISDRERQQLLFDWNQTTDDYELDQCLHERIEAQAASTPEAVAVTFEGRGISYRQLNTRANELAQHLQTFGVGPEVIVGVLMERSFEMMIGLLAILKAGAAYLPLDPEQPSERLSLILDDARPPVLLTQQVFQNRLQRDGMEIICLDCDWKLFGLENVDNVSSDVTPANVAYVIYTSGSTGQPKGVAISHAAISNRLLWMQHRFPLQLGDRVLQKTVYSFDASIWELFLPLMSGAKVVLLEPGAHRDAAALIKAIEQEAVTVLQMVPSMLAVLVEESRISECRSLRQVFSGGEALTESLQERFYERVSWAELINLYGPTEASIDASYYECERDRKRNKVLIGRPISNIQLYLLDEHQQPVPVGTRGELYIGGVGLARGYWRQAGLTAERFVPHPFGGETGARLYRTGDSGRYLSDGTIEYLGRLDHQVKIRGFRIELGEIEVALLEQPGVRDAVVLARDGDKRLVAYVVPVDSEGTRPLPDELRRALRETLPDYMVPQAFVLLEQLPLLPNGKLNSRALPEPEEWQEEKDNYVAPRTPIEEIVADVWANTLRIGRVGLYDNFFELGGHSLLATQVVSRIRQVFQIELPLRALFDEPTVHGFSRNIEVARGSVSSFTVPIEPVSRESELPLSFAQQRLWFLDQLESGNTAFNVASAIRLEGDLNVDALRRSFDSIISRHEVLRTSFTTINGRPVQVVHPPEPVSFQTTNLEDQSDIERSSEMRRLMDEEAQTAFDLTRGPLLRVLLLRLRVNEHVMLLTMHHIVSDGWSLGVLVYELSTLYEAFAKGESPELPELSIQYADFAAWQRKWLQGEVLETQLDYWRRHLADAPAMVELPLDEPRPLVQTYSGVNYHSKIEPETTNALRELSRREGASLFMTLLAAFQMLVSRYSGQEHVVVGTDVANRNRQEIEGLIGFIANQLVLHTDLSGNPSFRELLRMVREVTLGAYAHQDLPFEKLVEELRPERDSSRTPLFQLKIVMQNAPLPVIELTGLRLFSQDLGGATAKFDLTLFLEETPQGLHCTWQYNSDLFNARTIRRLAMHFGQLLDQIARNPDAHLREFIGTLDESEREERRYEKRKLATANFEKFKAMKPVTVNQ